MSRPFPDPPTTVPGALERAARFFPERGIAIFDGRGRHHERRTYPQVLETVRQAAGRWASLGVQPGDRVLVAQPTSWAWFEAWMGALFAGALPVAMARGAAMGAAEAHQVKVESVVERLAAKHAVVSDAFRREAKRSGLAPRTVEVAITAEELAGLAPQTVRVAEPNPEEIAFLQLTSGSTGVPRAVQIPHRAALHNSHANDLAIGHPHGAPTHQWADSMVSWLPLNHDMGLVGCLLLSIYGGLDLWLFEPSSFLARPRNWLEHIGSHGTAFTPAPNFGYQLCLERMTLEQRKGLDLSNWHDAMTGAEMIRPETVAGFCEAFEPYGFRPEAFRPCYGLAEGTLAVTFDHQACGIRTRPLPQSAATGMGLDEVVCVGSPVVDTEVRITSPSGRVLPEGEIGEVQAKGPSIFAGYYNDPQATAESLVEEWLVTGDLGFQHRGELYITGRVKDLIIVRGHNLMPHEIEWVAEGVTGGGGALRSGAFAVSRGAQGEEAVLVVEAESRDRDKLGEIGEEIRSRVGRTLSLPLADLVFVRRGRIPKTTSGKVQRRQLRELYLRGEIERL